MERRGRHLTGEQHLPSWGGSSPARASIVVVLPAPLAPSDGDDLAGVNLEIDGVDDRLRAVARGQTTGFDRRGRHRHGRGSGHANADRSSAPASSMACRAAGNTPSIWKKAWIWPSKRFVVTRTPASCRRLA